MTTSDTQHTGQGVVAIIRKQERFLMIRRAHHIRAGGMWCFVGGAIEPGESQEDALVRETREEVGLNVQPLEKVWQCLSLNRKWVLHCWSAKLLSDEIKLNPEEVAEFGWFSPQEIAVMPDVMPSVIDYFKTQEIL